MFENGLFAPGQFESPEACFHVGLTGLLAPLDVLLQTAPIVSPLLRHLLDEFVADLLVELVDIPSAHSLCRPSLNFHRELGAATLAGHPHNITVAKRTSVDPGRAELRPIR